MTLLTSSALQLWPITPPSGVGTAGRQLWGPRRRPCSDGGRPPPPPALGQTDGGCGVLDVAGAAEVADPPPSPRPRRPDGGCGILAVVGDAAVADPRSQGGRDDPTVALTTWTP